MTGQPPFSKGDGVAARYMNELEALRQRVNNFTVGPGLQVENTRSGVHVSMLPSQSETAAAATGGTTVHVMKAINWFTTQDVIKCYTYNYEDDATGETLIDVALPRILRRSLFDGKTIEGYKYVYRNNIQRTSTNATDPNDVTTQVIAPSWETDPYILAIPAPIGGTGVTASGEPVVWQCIDSGTRQWAVLP